MSEWDTCTRSVMKCGKKAQELLSIPLTAGIIVKFWKFFACFAYHLSTSISLVSHHSRRFSPTFHVVLLAVSRVKKCFAVNQVLHVYSSQEMVMRADSRWTLNWNWFKTQKLCASIKINFHWLLTDQRSVPPLLDGQEKTRKNRKFSFDDVERWRGTLMDFFHHPL